MSDSIITANEAAKTPVSVENEAQQSSSSKKKKSAFAESNATRDAAEDALGDAFMPNAFTTVPKTNARKRKQTVPISAGNLFVNTTPISSDDIVPMPAELSSKKRKRGENKKDAEVVNKKQKNEISWTSERDDLLTNLILTIGAHICDKKNARIMWEEVSFMFQ